MRKIELLNFIFEKYPLDEVAKKLVQNIVAFVALQCYDKDTTINTLEFFLSGIGITREEISEYVGGGESDV